MMRWQRIADRRTLALIVVLGVAAATPLVAQQDSVPAPPAGAGSGAVQGSSGSTTTASTTAAGTSTVSASAAGTSTALAGPRLRPEWRSAEPNFAGSRRAGSMVDSGDSHTITVTTLVLVLVVIIAVLLIVK